MNTPPAVSSGSAWTPSLRVSLSHFTRPQTPRAAPIRQDGSPDATPHLQGTADNRRGCFPASGNALTPRERDALVLLAGGDADVAAALGMRESTVTAHVSRILTALNVTNRVQAALRAQNAGLTGT